MSETGLKKKISPGEILVQAFLRLLQVVKIHQPNNKLFRDNLVGFRQVLADLWAENETVNLHYHKGRFFLNENRVIYSQAMWISAGKMIDYLKERQICGLGFTAREEIPDREIIRFIELLNSCVREEKPLIWLQARLEEENLSWAEPLPELEDPEALGMTGANFNADSRLAIDPDNPSAGVSGEALHGGGPGGGGPEGGGADGFGDLAHGLEGNLAAALEELEELEDPEEGTPKPAPTRLVYRKALCAVGRKVYSHTLGHVIKINSEITGHKRPGVLKSKRAVQDMIALLNEDESILLGMSTLRNYDDYTFTHSVNVAILSMCLGKRLGLSKLALEYLGLCALFHDLGKVDVPVELIRKPGVFTQEEFRTVQAHPLASVRRILRFNASPALKAQLILPPFEHHLGLDLSGYPQTGRNTPPCLFGRILAIADQYDAMSSSRAYRPVPISPERTLQQMIDQAGIKLDAVILKVFVKMIGVYPIGTLLLLDSRELALVMEVPEKSEEGRPIVLLLFPLDGNRFRSGDRIDLADKDSSGAFLRNVVRCCHPSEYGIQAADFLVA